MARSLVLKLGGSFLLAEGKPNLSMIQSMAKTVRSIVAQEKKLIVVVGGGVPARQYIGAASALGATKAVQDHFGIMVSRLNASLFIEALGDDLAYSEPATSLQAVRSSLQTRPVVVLGGLQPGQSTTAVAALCAEYVGADRVIFSTDVEGVFDKDPKKHPDAQLQRRVDYNRLRELTGSSNSGPGQYRLMDKVCLTILERSRIPACILLGTPENVLAAVAGDDVGTLIVPPTEE